MAIATRENVAKLYVAFFGRAADNNGLNYWVNDAGLTLEQISASFFDQPETLEKYPDELLDEAFVTEIYKNLFNHEPDQTGLDYWVAELELYEESGGTRGISRDKMILAVVNGAQDIPDEGVYDLTILNNKAEAGLYFADAGLEYVDFYLDDIGTEHMEVEILKDRVDHIVAEGSPELFIHLNEDITDDDTIDHDETGMLIAIEGYVYSSVAGNKTVTLEANETMYLQEIEKNDFSIGILGSELAADVDRTVEAVLAVTDDEGMVYRATAAEGYTVVEGDTTPPDAPVITMPIAGDDQLNTDEAENFSLGGTAEPFSTIDLLIYDSEGVEIREQTFAYASGEWGVVGLDLEGLRDGILRIEAYATDLAGNRSQVTATALILDTDTPEVLSVSLVNDTGLDHLDRVTSDPTLDVVLSDPFAKVEYSLDQIQWSEETPEYSEDGRYTVYVRAVDPVGNVSETRSRSFTLDREDPDAPLIERITTDSGILATDAVTNDTTLFFSGTVDRGALVELWLDGEAIGSVTASISGNWTKDYSSRILEDGTYLLTARATDVAGNVSVVSEAFFVTIDTEASLGDMVLRGEDDSGVYDDDNYTNVSSPSFNVTLGEGAQVGDTVELLMEGVPLVHTPAYTVSEEDAVRGYVTIRIREEDIGQDGVKVLNAKITDVAGNSNLSGDVSIVLDRTLPPAPDVSLAEDTGIAGDDLITANGAYDVVLKEEWNIAEYSLDGINWQKERPLFEMDGMHTVYVRAVDLAGNISADTTLTFRLDKTAPQKAELTSPVTDDGVVNASEASALALNGTAESQSWIEVTLHDQYGASMSFETVTDGTGKWLVNTSNVDLLSDGMVTVEIVSTDSAGNRSESAYGQFTLDTELPAVPEISLMWDTGVSDSDKITTNGTLNVSVEDPACTLEYSVNGSGWSSGVPVYGSDGYYAVSVRAVDSVGNVSPAAQLQFLLDTTAAPAPIVALENDNGTDGDLLTNDPALFVLPFEPEGEIRYFWNDAWQVTPPPFDDGDGIKTAYVREVDLAGNLSPITTFTFTLDATAPQMPVLMLANDTGSQTDDNITSDGSLVPIVPSEPESVVSYSVNSGTTWETEVPLFASDGEYTVWAKETDVAGNDSEVASLTFTLDSTAPVMVSHPAVTLTDTSIPAVELAYNETGEAGLYTDPDDMNSLIGEKVSLAKQEGEDRYVGMITLSPQSTTAVSAVIVTEDIAGNRSISSENVWMGTDMADTIGSETAAVSQLLYGFGGDDILTGGTMRDSFLGGEGSDSFVFSEGSGNTTEIIDVIHDFSTLNDSIVTGYAGDTNPEDYAESDGSGFADIAAMVNDAETNYLVNGTRYLFYYNASVEENSTEKVSGYLLIDWGDAPDGVVDQVVELVGLASADDFDAADIIA